LPYDQNRYLGETGGIRNKIRMREYRKDRRYTFTGTALKYAVPVKINE
jgi:hypothetical protein